MSCHSQPSTSQIPHGTCSSVSRPAKIPSDRYMPFKHRTFVYDRNLGQMQDKRQPARTAGQAHAFQKPANRGAADKRALTGAQTPQLRTSKRRRCTDDVVTTTVRAYAGAMCSDGQPLRTCPLPMSVDCMHLISRGSDDIGRWWACPDALSHVSRLQSRRNGSHSR